MTRTPLKYQSDWTLESFASARADHVLALACLNQQPLPAAEVQEHVLEALALSTRISWDALAHRWEHAVIGLQAGASIESVAAAVALSVAELRDAIASWADTQAEHGSMTKRQHAAVLALIGGEQS